MVFSPALCEHIYNTHQEVLKKYKFGLKAETTMYICERNPQTLDEATRLAKVFEVTRYCLLMDSII